MQPLKKRLRPDNIPSEQRVMRGRTGRTIYLLLLSAFALTVLNYHVWRLLFAARRRVGIA